MVHEWYYKAVVNRDMLLLTELLRRAWLGWLLRAGKQRLAAADEAVVGQMNHDEEVVE